MITPYYRATLQSRGRKHGHNQWQKDHAKNVDQNEEQRKVITIPRYSADGRTATNILYVYRASHVAIGWTETYVKYIDYLTTVDIKHDAPHRQRNRYENMIFTISDDPNSLAGPLWKREDYKTSTSALMCLQQEQGKGVPHIPMHMRTRQHNTLDPTIQQILVWLSQNWQTYFSTPTSSSSSSWSQNSTWWNSQHGKFSTVARVATKRMARPDVVGEKGKRREQTILAHTCIRKLFADEYCFNCCPSCPVFSNFFAVLHIHQPCFFSDIGKMS